MNIIPAFIRSQIEHRPNLLKILENIGWLFFDKILRMGVGLVVGIWYVRYLGPEQFGLFSFATAIVGLFGAIAGLGLQGIVVRDIVRDPTGKEATLGTAALLLFISGLITYGLILGTTFWLSSEETLAKALVAILGSALVFQASGVALYWFESQVLSKYNVWVKNINFLVFAAIKVALILNNAPLIAFAWLVMAEALSVAVMMLVMLSLRGPRLKLLRVSLSRATGLLADSWPLLLSGILISINLKFDQIMITSMVSEDANGKYAAAAAIPQLVIGLLMLIETSLYPKNIADSSQGDRSLISSLVKVTTLVFYLSVAASVLLFVLAKPIVPVLYGEAYVDSVSIIQILVLIIPLSSLVRIQGQYCQIKGKTVLVMYRQLFIACCNIFLNWLLLPIYGAMGAAYAIVLSLSLGIALSLILDQEFRKIPVHVLLKPDFSYLRFRK